MLLQASADQYHRQGRLTAAVLRQARTAWGKVDFADLDGSWPRFAAPTLLTLTAGQRAAAAGAAEHVGRAIAEQNKPDDPAGQVNAAALAGVASDGRPLDTLLYEPVIAVKSAIKRSTAGDPALLAWWRQKFPGQDRHQAAMASGAFSLDRIIVTQMMDAARTASGIAVTVRHGYGYIRVLNPPSCARCAILAGRWYRWNADFDRHTSCDCAQTPAAEGDAKELGLVDPREAITSGQVTGLSRAESQAIREGADPAQVVNVHRKGGIYSVGGKQFAREGTTRHGLFGSANRGTRRITPQQIYREAGDDRDEAIRLLRRFGYLD